MFVSYMIVIHPFICKGLTAMETLQFFSFPMISEQVWQILAIVICSKCAAFIFAGFSWFPFMCSSYVTHFGPFPQEGFGTPRAVVNTILMLCEYMVIHVIFSLLCMGTAWEGTSDTPLSRQWL